MKQIMIKNLVV